MKRKVWLLSLVVAIMISLGVFTLKGFGKEETKDEKQLDLKILSEKIDKILKNQEDIIERLKDIRQEEDVIRVRASQR